MSEYVHPENPLSVTPNFKKIAPALIIHAVETFAFLSIPFADEVPTHLVMHGAHQWAIRMTQQGAEDESTGVVWELAVFIQRMIQEGIPFPPFDITTNCGDVECDVDHGAQARVINDLFAAARNGRPQDAVQAFIRYVALQPPAEWKESRAAYVAMLLVHTAERVCEFRASLTPELPELPTGEDAHDYEPDSDRRPSPMSTDSPCRICGQSRRDCEK